MTGSTDAKDYDPSIPVSEWFERRSAQRKVRWRAAAAAMVILAVTGSVPFWLASRGERLVTPVGQNRAVRLTDGSRVELGGDTEVRVHLNRTSRRLELVRGEAFFSVARDATRPFEVRAGKTRVTAVGTAFNVRRGAERIVVAVLEGRVTIAGAERRAPMPVDAGEQTIVIRSSVTAAVPIANAQSATAWQSGRLSFDHEPLRYVLEDVNRYAPKPIVIDDPAVENLQISGTVLSDNVPGWIRSIVSAFELEVTETEDAIVLRQAR
jgi:transmembrane sensor